MEGQAPSHSEEFDGKRIRKSANAIIAEGKCQKKKGSISRFSRTAGVEGWAAGGRGGAAIRQFDRTVETGSKKTGRLGKKVIKTQRLKEQGGTGTAGVLLTGNNQKG